MCWISRAGSLYLEGASWRHREALSKRDEWSEMGVRDDYKLEGWLYWKLMLATDGVPEIKASIPEEGTCKFKDDLRVG